MTCGITFTFGGLASTPHGAGARHRRQPIPGLYAAGELVGGLFYFNYPGGTGLMSGAVFGRIAGAAAAGADGGPAMSDPWPTELRLHKDRRSLAVAFDSGESFDLAAEYLRVRSPSAEVQGHSPSERRTVAGKRDVQDSSCTRSAITRCGSSSTICIRPASSPGTISSSCSNREQYWSEYLSELKAKHLSRAPAGKETSS